MNRVNGEEADFESYFDKSAPVFQLRNDWGQLLDILPQLHTSATVYRGLHAIHCQQGRFPKMSLVEGHTLQSDGECGISLNTDCWSEAWWHFEERMGELLPSLEIADDHGRGLFKVCYNNIAAAESDFNLIRPLITAETNAWSILHLNRANMMDCYEAYRLQRCPRFLDALRAMQRECLAKQGRLGLILASDSQSTWDSLIPFETDPSCCWLGFGNRGNYINIAPAGYHHAEVITCGSRGIVTFLDKDNFPALSLVEPEGLRLNSLRRLARHLARSSENNFPL